MMTPLWQISLSVPQAQAAIFAALFEDDALALTVQSPPRHALAQIAALYDAAPDTAHYQKKLADIAIAQGFAVPECLVIALPIEDWLQKVAVATPPRTIGRLVIYGAHDAAQIPFYQPKLQIEAATAFGTGEHPSTQMCLRLLQDILRKKKPRRALDVGCGSGILALALARLAHRPSWAVDFDAESVRMARVNAVQNGLASYLHALTGHGYQARAVRQHRLYDLVFANIFARPLMALAADLRAHLAPNGYAILAGLLTTQVPMVLAAHKMQRLHLVRHICQGEWSALLLQKRHR
jgi:ribosomal protein L11 methyltransferase